MVKRKQRKKFMLFGYDTYYPQGGSGDVVGVFDTMEDVVTVPLSYRSDYYEVLDLDTGEWSTVERVK